MYIYQKLVNVSNHVLCKFGISLKEGKENG